MTGGCWDHDSSSQSKPHNFINPVPSTACCCLHLLLLSLLVTQASPFYIFLQPLFTTARAEASRYSSHASPVQSLLPKPWDKLKISTPVTPSPGETALQTRSVEFIRAKLILCFPSSSSTLRLCNLLPSPGSCIAAVAVEQKTRFAFQRSQDESTLRWMGAG